MREGPIPLLSPSTSLLYHWYLTNRKSFIKETDHRGNIMEETPPFYCRLLVLMCVGEVVEGGVRVKKTFQEKRFILSSSIYSFPDATINKLGE
jgi:hypothetical protein